MGTKAMYYRWMVSNPDTGELALDEDGNKIIESVGPLAADGDWPARYAARGLSLQPPSDEPPAPDASEWRELFAEYLEDGFTLEDARLFLEELTAEEEDDEEVDLEDMKRADLNALAASLGVENPDKLQNKDAVIAAIQEKKAAQSGA